MKSRRLPVTRGATPRSGMRCPSGHPIPQALWMPTWWRPAAASAATGGWCNRRQYSREPGRLPGCRKAQIVLGAWKREPGREPKAAGKDAAGDGQAASGGPYRSQRATPPRLQFGMRAAKIRLPEVMTCWHRWHLRGPTASGAIVGEQEIEAHQSRAAAHHAPDTRQSGRNSCWVHSSVHRTEVAAAGPETLSPHECLPAGMPCQLLGS